MSARDQTGEIGCVRVMLHLLVIDKAASPHCSPLSVGMQEQVNRLTFLASIPAIDGKSKRL